MNQAFKHSEKRFRLPVLLFLLSILLLLSACGSGASESGAGTQTVIPAAFSASEDADAEQQDPEKAEAYETAPAEPAEVSEETETADAEESPEVPELTFRNADRLNEHYEKHGIEMGFSSAEEYQAAAAAVVSNPDALHKTEAEDGDDVYYLEATNDFVIVSTDGYIRTYFRPDAGIDYYNRQ